MKSQICGVEYLRKSIHIGSLAIALLMRFRWFEPWMMLTIAGAGVLFNIIFLPKIGLIYRDNEPRRYSGVVFFPLSLLILTLVFWTLADAPYAVAAGWSLMSIGDGFATLAGKASGKGVLPWNPKKSYAGLAAFVVTGAVGTILFIHWVGMRDAASLSWAFAALSGGVAAALCGIIESLPLPVSDNLTVPLIGGTFVYLFHLAL
jgi:dolichol kinase